MKTKRIPNFYFIITVFSYKNKKEKYTSIHIMSDTKLSVEEKNNTVSKTYDNNGVCTWSVNFYLESDNKIYTPAKMIKKALKYAKKKGVKIFKNNIDII